MKYLFSFSIEKFSPLLLLALLALFSASVSAQLCSTNPYACPLGACCSRSGFCGFSADHCGPGCLGGACYQKPLPQGFPLSISGFCSNSGPYCDPDSCCSRLGNCGTGPEFCGIGCIHGNCEKGFIDPVTMFNGESSPRPMVRNATMRNDAGDSVLASFPIGDVNVALFGVAAIMILFF